MPHAFRWSTVGTSYGITLMAAAKAHRLGMPDIVTLLLARGANPDIQSNAGHTPLDYARKRNDPEIIALLGG